jgi:hypothetical protein
MLKEKHLEFKAMLQLQQEEFKKEVQQFRQIWEEFKQTESRNKDLVSISTYSIGVPKLREIVRLTT